MQGNNIHLQYVLHMCALENCLSPRGFNLKRCEGEYDLSLSELMPWPHNMIRHQMHGQYNDSSSIQGEEWAVSGILELMDCKRGMGTYGLNDIYPLIERVSIDWWLLDDRCCI